MKDLLIIFISLIGILVLSSYAINLISELIELRSSI